MKRWKLVKEIMTAPRVFLAVVDPSKRLRLTGALERIGCDVVATHSGYHLLERIADALLDDGASRADALVFDAILPGCTGLSLLEGLRDLQWDVPIILLNVSSADQASDLRDRARSLGRRAFPTERGHRVPTDDEKGGTHQLRHRITDALAA